MIEFEKQGAICSIYFNRPEKLNAMTLAMYEQLGAAFSRARDDEEIKVIILASRSAKAFCVGADLTESIPALAENRFDISEWDPAHLKNTKMYKPVIAAVQGLCIGGGFEFMLATDIRIASTDAVFQLPEANLGLVPAGGTLTRLARQVSYAHAMQLMLLGERVSADELYRMGVVNEVVTSETVYQRALDIAHVLANKSTIALQTIKEAALTLYNAPLQEAFAKEAELGQQAFTSSEAKAGISAFITRGKRS